VLRCTYNVDFGYISLFAVIGIVAAYAATIPITANNNLCALVGQIKDLILSTRTVQLRRNDFLI